MDYIFLPIIVLLGLITSLEDFKLGKIRNVWIIFGLVLGGLGWFWFGLISPLVDIFYLFKIALNFFFASLVGFFMWKLKAWSAGDAKMLILYSFLTPFSFYSNSYLAFFPSFVIIFNTFLLLLLFLLLRSSLFGLKQALENKISFSWKSETQNAKNYFFGLSRFLSGFLLFMITISWSYKYLQDYISLNFFLYQILAVTVIIIFQSPLTRLFQKRYANKIAFGLFLVFFALGLYADRAFTLASMGNVFFMIFLFMILFPIFNRMINFHLDNTNKKEINIADLKAGMIVAPESIALLGFKENSGQKFGLNYSDVETVKKEAQAQNLKSIFITQPFYFAIWLFLGVIATLLARGSLLSWVLSL